MTEHNNPGPPRQCYDDCPTNQSGDTEDCTCAGTAVDGDLRERIFHIVLTAQRAEQNHGNTVTIAEWARDEIMPVIERLSKLAEANGQQARFWADHFAEIERANRDALGAHHKPGHSVAELITAVVAELADAQASYWEVKETLESLKCERGADL